MNITCWRLTVIYFVLMIIAIVLSQDECERPVQFTSKAVLDKYLRCLKSKMSPRYGKRIAPSMTGKLRPNWFLPGKPSDGYYNHLYRILQTLED